MNDGQNYKEQSSNLNKVLMCPHFLKYVFI